MTMIIVALIIISIGIMTVCPIMRGSLKNLLDFLAFDPLNTKLQIQKAKVPHISQGTRYHIIF